MKKRTLRTNLRTLTLLSLTLLTVFGILFYAIVGLLSQKRSFEYYEGLAAKSEQSVSAYLDEIQRMANLASYSRSVQEYLFGDTPYVRATAQRAATDLITNIMSFSTDIREIAFVTQEGRLIQASGGYSALIRSVAETENTHVFQGRGESCFTRAIYNTYNSVDASTPYFCYIYPVYSMLEGGFSADPVATCLVLVKLSDLAQRHMEGMNINEATVILIEEDRLVFTSRPLSEDEESVLSATDYGGSTFTLGGDMQLAFRHHLQGTPWDAAIIAPEASFSRDIEPIRTVIVIFILGGTILQVLLLVLSTHRLTSPLNRLLSSIQRIDISSDDFQHIPPVDIEEIDMLSGSINEMLDRISRMEKEQEETRQKLYEASLLKKQTQLQYYRSQINPHFLYNTLECISAMARLSEVSCVESICASMADMFRYSVSDTFSVTVRQEVTHAENYYNVISQRSKNRFHLRTRVSPECWDVKIQKMILQPILENSIKHGFEGKEAPCNILIAICLNAHGQLCITAADNGYGIPPMKIRQLNQDLQSDYDDHAKPAGTDIGIGLFNINQRLKLAYNGRSYMEVRSQYGYYTCVRIWLPLLKE